MEKNKVTTINLQECLNKSINNKVNTNKPFASTNGVKDGPPKKSLVQVSFSQNLNISFTYIHAG